MKKNYSWLPLLVLMVAMLGLDGCGGGGGSDTAGSSSPGSSTPTPDSPDGDDTDELSEGRTFTVSPGPDATQNMVNAMIQLKPGDTLQFTCGFFDINQSLLIQATEDVTVKGCGKNKTVLNFRDSINASGLEALNVRGLTVADMTILDSPGDAFKLKGVKWGTLRGVRAIWSGGGGPITAENYGQRLQVACTAPPYNEGDATPDYVPSADSGRYGIYPVESENILVDDSESIGASDAGIYVGQTNTAIIRNSRAAYNVMGFEIENVRGGEYDSNTAECNTGGFLIYDLENITQYGNGSVMLNNTARNNNTYNFASSGIVSMVPRGVGFITLGYDNIELYKNTFEDHSTAAILYVSYELIDGKGKTADKKLDPYTEGLHIHDNVMRHSGYDLPPPDLQAALGGDINTLLPTLIGLKNLPTINDPARLLASLQNLANLGKGAHIIWDGLRDDLDADCPYPVDADGNPVPKQDDGKPILTDQDPNPSCHYNAYKFDSNGKRKLPEWGSCFHDNDLSGDSAPYLNFHGTDGLELAMGLLGQDLSILSPSGLMSILKGTLNFPSDTRLSDHDCQTRFGKVLDSLPRVHIPPFEPSGDYDPANSAEYVNKLCNAEVGADQINRGALEVDCPLLSQYNLFADPGNPRSMPHEGGVPFVLNSKLFSDNATKWRVMFIPPGEQALYKDGQNGNNPDGTLEFPTGTVIAKTFAFTDEAKGTEELVETRLLIKRISKSGKALWAGLPYIWDDDGVARLTPGGGTRAVSWHYHDVNTGKLLTGSTDQYSVPNANQCITCHGNDDRPSGSAPIGPKVRNLNRPYEPESAFMDNHGQASFPHVNQLQYLIDHGLLTGAPALKIDGRGIATNVERLPRWNVPGDGGDPAGSPADIEHRMRAYLEVNCQHCHNDRGAASNTGFYLDHFGPVDVSYGVCKKPTATGGGSCGRQYVIVPGSADDSIIACRIAAEHDPEKMMPPIARSVAHTEAVNLMNQWINTVVDSDYSNAGSCR